MVDGPIFWRFYGYITPGGGRDVQEWFDGLLEDEKDEARDVLAYLQQLPRNLWSEPHFKLLDADVSEIRFKVNLLKRIYQKGSAIRTLYLLAKTRKLTMTAAARKKQSNGLGNCG